MTFNDMVWALRSYRELQVDRLIEEKTKTESIIFSIADGLVMTDSLGKIQIMNRRAIEAFGIGLGEQGKSDPWSWVSKNILDVVTEPQMKGVLENVISAKDPQSLQEVIVSAGQEVRHYQISSERVVNPRNRRELGLVAVVHDVTLERELDKLKENFLHSITHDLRNPMTSIQGFIKVLSDERAGPVNETQKGMLDTMDRASVRFLAMISDILDIAKIEAGSFEPNLSDFELDPMLETMSKIYQPMAEKRKISLNVTWLAKSRPVKIRADENLIERVIGNLVANALKFTSMNGQVSVKVEDGPDRLQISVSDTGTGIPEDMRKKVFDKFQQAVTGATEGWNRFGSDHC